MNAVETGPPASHANKHLSAVEVKSRREDRLLIERLVGSTLFRDFAKSFRVLTGMPISFRPRDSLTLIHATDTNANPFCQCMAANSRSGAACLTIQERVAAASDNSPSTVQCFAGLVEAAVPVRLGERVLGHIMFGQFAHAHRRAEGVARLVELLTSRGVTFHEAELRKAYLQTPVISRANHAAAVRLVELFACHLGRAARDLDFVDQDREGPRMRLARRIISERYTEPLHSGDVARTLHASRFYFCKQFKASTGMTFTTYLSRFRIQRAMELLRNPHRGVAEIAYEVGFGCVGQFNRAFRRYVGMTPSVYRKRKDAACDGRTVLSSPHRSGFGATAGLRR